MKDFKKWIIKKIYFANGRSNSYLSVYQKVFSNPVDRQIKL